MTQKLTQTTAQAALLTSSLQRFTAAIALWALLALAACSQTAQEPAPTDTASEASPTEEVESVSILRPEIETPQAEPTPQALAPYRATIGFPEGGSALSERAIAALEAALASPQMELGLPITLGSHSDSSGSDTVNLDASQERGLAVAKWLIDNGVDPDRITVIAFGEQNPVEPNARPDGAPNEAGRAANRRVELEIEATAEAAAPAADASEEPEASALEAGD